MPQKPTYEELEQRVRELEALQIENKQPVGTELKNRRFLSDLIDNSGTSIFIKDCEGRYLMVNRKWEDVTGLARDSILGKTDADLFPAESARQFRENDLRVIETGSVLVIEECLAMPAGQRYFISSKFPMINDNGTIAGLCTVITEITDRKQVEVALRRSEAMQRKLLYNIGDVIVIIDRNGVNRYQSPNIEKMFGWNPEEIVGTSIWDRVHHEDLENAKRLFNSFINVPNEPNAVRTIECRYLCKDGSYKWIEFTGSNLLDDPDVQGILGNFHDIMQRKQAEQRLRDSEERFKALHNASFGGIGIHDKGIILDCNQGLAEMTGYSLDELIGMNGMLLIAEKSRDYVMQKILSGYEKPYEAFGLRKNGTEFPMRLEARNIPYKGKTVRTVEFRDMTEIKRAEEERKKLEAQLAQAQKMESVGRLAGGVAHDYNNMISVILGYTELALEKVAPSDSLHANLSEIYKAAKRSAEITGQLLAFARKQTIAPKVYDLNKIVEHMFKMLRRLIGEDIHITWIPQSGLWSVMIDPTQMEQVLANLCVNARDAIAGVGDITIETRRVTLDQAFCVDHPGFNPGQYVLLKVSDNGCGMNNETLAHIFEPFFTSKDVTKGTGLGLATIYGIVKQNNGHINVSSKPGKGTSFEIYLPRHIGEAEEIITESEVQISPGNGERVLLVEDDPAIREMCEIFLETLQYKVLCAETPEAALRLAGEDNCDINLLITDVVMPGMNGRDLAKALHSIHPEIKTLFMSGYTADVIAHRGVLEEEVQFIQKPFSIKDFSAKVRETLNP